MSWAAPGQQSPKAETRQEKQSPDQKKSSRGGSLTGCVDEQEGHYVLLDDRDLTRIAILEPVGFPKEGFAKHLGHKVIVRGTAIAGSSPTRFQVRAIETVSNRCTP